MPDPPTNACSVACSIRLDYRIFHFASFKTGPSSDRAIRDYCTGIWKTWPVKIEI
jgi:hypothetical protein